MTTITATPVLGSINAQSGDRVATLLLRYPRPIHSEFMTHRVFSRNAASSRAIPVKRIIQDVIDDPYVPLVWGKNQKGMQGGEDCDDEVRSFEFDVPHGSSWTREEAWLFARDNAIKVARAFDAAGYHKQVVNRLLEPWAHITVVVTSTDWSNFLALRDHFDAEPHIQILAKRVREALEGVAWQALQPGEWHLPFVGPEDRADIGGSHEGQAPETFVKSCLDKAIKLSVARCASTSYKTVEGFDMTLERAIALHDRLVSSVPMHASPAEHQCYADEIRSTCQHDDVWDRPDLHGNFTGFCQYRKTLKGERQ